MKSSMLVVSIALASCAKAGHEDAGRNSIADQLKTCQKCVLEVQDAWASEKGDPNTQEASFYIEADRNLWAMGGVAEEILVRFDMGEGKSKAYRRYGKGPGEFSDQVTGAALDPSGDTLVIAEGTRLQYFSPTDLEYYRSFPVRDLYVRGGLLVLEDGSIVFSNSRVVHPKAQNRALHHFSHDGEYIGSVTPIDSDNRVWIPIARGKKTGTAWAAITNPNGFRAEQWDVTTGQKLRDFTFEADGGIQDRRFQACRLKPKREVASAKSIT